MAYRGRRRLALRRGQAEVIGGLFVLTLIFLVALPIIMNYYNQTLTAVENVARSSIVANVARNERIVIQPLDPNNEDYLALGWIPGVFIVNAGTVEVELVKAYIINKATNKIDYVIDLTTLRPADLTPTHIVKAIALNPSLANPNGEPLPPEGEPITLGPGDQLLLAFNIVNPDVYVIAVQSALGVLHPVGGGGENGLVPQAGGGTGTGTGTGEGVYKGIFAPLSGFKMLSGEEISSKGFVKVWRPRNHVQALLSYRATFIYDDDRYPGMYKIYIKSDETDYVYTDFGNCYVRSGWEVYIYGFIGTYYPFEVSGFFGTENYVYVDGYAFLVEVYDSNGNLECTLDVPLTYNVNPDTTIDLLDFDGNGVNELTFYTRLNTPVTGDTGDVDVDGDGNAYRDVVLWEYVVQRDIGNVDFIQVSGKINYYWTKIFTYSCPSSFRSLKIFSIVVWKFDDVTGKWRIYNWKDYFYVNDKPRQFQFFAVFPVERNGTYRVGIIFYDNYRVFYDPGYNVLDCATEFTYALEYMNVEYGVINPLFEETPPIYIVAIPDPNKISGIGEYDYANLYGITDINQAKVMAQQELLSILTDELKRVGIGAYTVIDTEEEFCNVLFPDLISGNVMQPPKNAIIFWLQGDTDIQYLVNPAICGISYADVRDHVAQYNWVFVQMTGTPFWSLSSNPELYFLQFTYGDIAVIGGGNATITDGGVAARGRYAFIAMLNELPFLSRIQLSTLAKDYVVPNATFYYNPDDDAYGHVAVLNVDPNNSSSMGAYVLMHVHIDWDMTGDGVDPLTLVQMAVGGGLEAWKYIVTQLQASTGG